MPLPLSQWDPDYLDEVITHQESPHFDRKASALLKPGDKVRITSGAAGKIAKAICAFANAGDGFLVFGLNDEKETKGPAAKLHWDQGLPATVGNEPIKKWFEIQIQHWHRPAILHCEARHIHHPKWHTSPELGVLVVHTPLSEFRPHISLLDDTAYIRAGDRSEPMRQQTLLDLFGRASLPAGRVVDLGVRVVVGTSVGADNVRTIAFAPSIQLDTGPLTENWLLEVELNSVAVSFRWGRLVATGGYRVGLQEQEVPAALAEAGQSRFVARAHGPLFPGRDTPVFTEGRGYACTVIDGVAVRTRLFVGSARPVRQDFQLRFAPDNRVEAVAIDAPI